LGSDCITREVEFSGGSLTIDVGKFRKTFGAIPDVEVGTWWETRSACLLTPSMPVVNS
jgi:hypothetical protein